MVSLSCVITNVVWLSVTSSWSNKLRKTLILVELTILSNVLSSLGPKTKPCSEILLLLSIVALVNVAPPIVSARTNTSELKLRFLIEISPEPVTIISLPADTVANKSLKSSADE